MTRIYSDNGELFLNTMVVVADFCIPEESIHMLEFLTLGHQFR